VDFEDQTRDLEAAEIARRFFSGAEASAVEAAGGPERLRTFFQIWTLKEAALKSIGEGLPFGLDRFEFELAPKPRVVSSPDGHGDPEHFIAHVVERNGSCTAIVIRRLA
jgi:4'-phosphopantetheinyl transferase